jgi:hypothetical protein
MNQAEHDGRFIEAVWDATPIIRMFCAELDGRCACLKNVHEHVYPQIVADELRRRNRADILGHLDRDGEEIVDPEYADTILNAMCGSMVFHVREHPDIDTHNIRSEYNLNDTDGEFWVIAYAISKATDKILVVIDDGPALDGIYRALEGIAQQHFTVWTSLHIIWRLMTTEKVLTIKRGSQLFIQLYNTFSERLNENVQRELENMRLEINKKKFRKEHRIAVVKGRPFYHYDGQTQRWVFPPSL